MPSDLISYLSVARFSGDDALAFLQSQLSADIEALEPGGTTLACYCTPRGQVLGLLLVGRREDDLLVAGHAALLPGILRRLGMFVLRSRVVIEPAPQLQVAALDGPAYRFADAGDGAAEAGTWKATELAAGITWLNEASSEKFIPQMLGFETIGAVSFQKGCYPGQEIVARARYLGKVKRGPLIVETEGLPALVAGEKVKVRRGDEWADAVVVDRAENGAGGAVVFTVAARAEQPADALEHGAERYRCATM